MMVTAPLGSMRTKALGVNTVVADACAAALAAPGRCLHQERADAAELAPRELRRRAGRVAGRAFLRIAALRGQWIHRRGDSALIVKP
jgi:hypothetical protein